MTVAVWLTDPPGVDLSTLRRLPGYTWSVVQRLDPPAGPNGNRRLIMPVVSATGSAWTAIVLVSPSGHVVSVTPKGAVPSTGQSTKPALAVCKLLLRDATGGRPVVLYQDRPGLHATGSALYSGKPVLAGMGHWSFQFRGSGVLVSMEGRDPVPPPPSAPPTGLLSTRTVESELAKRVVWKPSSTRRRANFNGRIDSGWVCTNARGWRYCYRGFFRESEYFGNWFAGSWHGGGQYRIVDALTGAQIDYPDIKQ